MKNTCKRIKSITLLMILLLAFVSGGCETTLEKLQKKAGQTPLTSQTARQGAVADTAYPEENAATREAEAAAVLNRVFQSGDIYEQTTDINVLYGIGQPTDTKLHQTYVSYESYDTLTKRSGNPPVISREFSAILPGGCQTVTLRDDEAAPIRQLMQRFLYSLYDFTSYGILNKGISVKRAVSLQTEWRSQIFTGELLEAFNRNGLWEKWFGSLSGLSQYDYVGVVMDRVYIAPDNLVCEHQNEAGQTVTTVPVEFAMKYYLEADNKSRDTRAYREEHRLFPEGSLYITVDISRESGGGWRVVSWKEYRPLSPYVTVRTVDGRGIAEEGNALMREYLDRRLICQDPETMDSRLRDRLYERAMGFVKKLYTLDYSTDTAARFEELNSWFTLDLRHKLNAENFFSKYMQNIQKHRMVMNAREAAQGDKIGSVVAMKKEGERDVYEITVRWDITDFNSSVERATFAPASLLEEFDLSAICDDDDLQGLVTQEGKQTVIAFREENGELLVCYWRTVM